MYILGERPATPNSAYDTLENVFGGDEFSAQEATSALTEVMEISESTARTELNNLFRTGAVTEA